MSFLKNIFFPIGKKQKILFGPLQGQKIIITTNTQWAPIIGRWEPVIQKILSRVLEKGNIYYDLGANFGIHGLLAAKKIAQSGHVYNFEPLPDNIDEINKNYELNNIYNFTNIKKAVSNVNGVANFNLGSHNTQGSLSNDNVSNNSINVELITLDSFINEGNPFPNFIKMDIEGAEGDALEGYSMHIEKSFPNMIIELHNPEADKKVGDFLKFYNYDVYRFNSFGKVKFEKIVRLDKPWPNPDGIWGSIFCINKRTDLKNFQF